MQLLVTSGRGPAECRLAVAEVVRLILKEAKAQDLDTETIPGPDHAQGHGPGSVVVVVDGEGAESFARTWVGSIQQIAASTVRPGHKRKNWFVSVSKLDEIPPATQVLDADVRVDTFRAGGPGGQHQNTTDSAVRVVHIPTGLKAIARDGKSQHQNRKLAMRRLSELLEMKAAMARGSIQEEAQRRHDTLERGNPVRVLRG